jgi:hypothetical protein
VHRSLRVMYVCTTLEELRAIEREMLAAMQARSSAKVRGVIQRATRRGVPAESVALSDLVAHLALLEARDRARVQLRDALHGPVGGGVPPSGAPRDRIAALEAGIRPLRSALSAADACTLPAADADRVAAAAALKDLVERHERESAFLGWLEAKAQREREEQRVANEEKRIDDERRRQWEEANARRRTELEQRRAEARERSRAADVGSSSNGRALVEEVMSVEEREEASRQAFARWRAGKKREAREKRNAERREQREKESREKADFERMVHEYLLTRVRQMALAQRDAGGGSGNFGPLSPRSPTVALIDPAVKDFPVVRPKKMPAAAVQAASISAAASTASASGSESGGVKPRRATTTAGGAGGGADASDDFDSTGGDDPHHTTTATGTTTEIGSMSGSGSGSSLGWDLSADARRYLHARMERIQRQTLFSTAEKFENHEEWYRWKNAQRAKDEGEFLNWYRTEKSERRRIAQERARFEQTRVVREVKWDSNTTGLSINLSGNPEVDAVFSLLAYQEMGQTNASGVRSASGLRPAQRPNIFRIDAERRNEIARGTMSVTSTGSTSVQTPRRPATARPAMMTVGGSGSVRSGDASSVTAGGGGGGGGGGESVSGGQRTRPTSATVHLPPALRTGGGGSGTGAGGSLADRRRRRPQTGGATPSSSRPSPPTQPGSSSRRHHRRGEGTAESSPRSPRRPGWRSDNKVDQSSRPLSAPGGVGVGTRSPRRSSSASRKRAQQSRVISPYELPVSQGPYVSPTKRDVRDPHHQQQHSHHQRHSHQQPDHHRSGDRPPRQQRSSGSNSSRSEKSGPGARQNSRAERYARAGGGGPPPRAPPPAGYSATPLQDWPERSRGRAGGASSPEPRLARPMTATTRPSSAAAAQGSEVIPPVASHAGGQTRRHRPVSATTGAPSSGSGHDAGAQQRQGVRRPQTAHAARREGSGSQQQRQQQQQSLTAEDRRYERVGSALDNSFDVDSDGEEDEML